MNTTAESTIRTTALALVETIDPAAVAVSTVDCDLTYRELDAWSNRLARVLLELGAGPGVRIAVAVDPAIEAAVTRMAIAKTGAVEVDGDLAPFGVDLGVTTEARRAALSDSVRWLVLDDRSTLVRYMTGSDAPITDADRMPARQAS
ncbi:AMP-binding protein [Nocardia bovistercoris]|uniref:AMP-binding protein n=1 Tax=Nocardia bovistercoris TaxID=2785916 RepID=A0A931IAY7_9NOCA|nr:AMP-binding protein [Nocardia bovistercoris]MBH0776867.1 AMP-binding protein [Nocardia bovistercoris]